MHRDLNQKNNVDPVDQRQEHQQLEQLRRRQTLRIALAAILAWIAISTSSQGAGLCGMPNPCGWPLQFDGFTPSTIDVEVAASLSQQIAYVQLYAELANFDRDVDADGWLASVVLRDRDGSALVGPALMAPATATFEILDHADLVATGRNDGWDRNPSSIIHPPLVWRVPLEFNQHGVAAITLPASRSVQRSLGWDSAAVHQAARVASDDGLSRRSRIVDGDRHRRFVTRPVRDVIDVPRIGWLKIHVTIPGQRSLEAAVPIDLRPAVLVDTYGRSR